MILNSHKLLGLALVASVLWCASCVTTETVAPGSDPVVVNAERFYQTAFHLADGFLEWEYANRNTLPAEVQNFADEVRRRFPPAYDAFKSSVRAYKISPTAENHETLQKLRAALQALVDEIRLWAPRSVEKAADQKRSWTPQ